MKVIFEGKQINILENESILDAFERNGVYIRSSCRSGICNTCVLKIVSGKVKYTKTPLLWNKHERVLTCIAQPIDTIILKKF